jgi:predicted porin
MVAQADATLYGKFEMRVVDAENADLEVQSDDFRVGVKGDSDIAGGSKALFNLELEVNPENPTSSNSATADTSATNAVVRKAYVGATGDWGTALIGRIANPAEQIVGFTGNNSELLPHDLNPDHLGSAIAYVTPGMGGFTGYAAIVAEGEGNDAQDNVDGKLIGGSFAAGGLTVAASYWSFTDTYVAGADSLSLAQIGGQYSIDMTTIGLSYAKRDNADGTTEDKVVGLRVDQKIGDLTLGANYFDYDFDSSSIDNQYGLFAVYSLGAQASLDFEYTDLSADLAADENKIMSVGYTVKF